eukprot:1157523-Pelagomonas_calceolata.AAC.6
MSSWCGEWGMPEFRLFAQPFLFRCLSHVAACLPGWDIVTWVLLAGMRSFTIRCANLFASLHLIRNAMLMCGCEDHCTMALQSKGDRKRRRDGGERGGGQRIRFEDNECIEKIELSLSAGTGLSFLQDKQPYLMKAETDKFVAF